MPNRHTGYRAVRTLGGPARALRGAGLNVRKQEFDGEYRRQGYPSAAEARH